LELLQEMKTLPEKPALYGSGQRRKLWQTCHMWTLSVSFLMESSLSSSSTPSTDALITNLTGDLRARRTTHVTTTSPLACFHSSPRAPRQSCFPRLWRKYRSSFCSCNKAQAQKGKSVCCRPNLHKVLAQCRLMLVEIPAVVPGQLYNFQAEPPHQSERVHFFFLGNDNDFRRLERRFSMQTSLFLFLYCHLDTSNFAVVSLHVKEQKNIEMLCCPSRSKDQQPKCTH